ncbi:hypothetical protein ABPG74_006187 [Tetrahymena malaccensis]
MKNQSSNSSVDIEINSQSQKPSQQLLGPSIILKDHQEERTKSNSSSQNSTFRKVHSNKCKNEKNKRPSSVTQRPSSIPKFVSSFSNEAQKLGLNGNTRSQDDSYAVNSLISSMNNSYYIQQNTHDTLAKPKQQNSYHQRGSSLQTIGQVSVFSAQYANNPKGGSSQSLQNQAAQSQSLANSFVSINQQALGSLGEDKSGANVCQSFSAAISAQPVSEVRIAGPEVNNLQASSQSQLLSDNLVFKHASSLDLPHQSSLNMSSKLLNQQASTAHKFNTKQQNEQQTLKSQKHKQKNILENEEDCDQKDKQEDVEQNEQNLGELQQAQCMEVLAGVINSKADSENQSTQVQIQGNNIFGINTELDKIDLNNSSSSKHTSNSITSRSHKNQSNISDDFLQDSKQESANNNSMIISSSNNSSRVFKGSSNNSFILNQCTQKVAASNPLNEFIQSKEEIKESIRSKCSAKPRDAHILQNARFPIKPILPDESKNQILSVDDKLIPPPSIQVIQKPGQDMNESQLKGKLKSKQLMHRRGNTLSRNDIEDFQFFEFQDSAFPKGSSEDEKVNSNQLENKQISQENLSSNPLSFINPVQVYDFQIKNNEEDNQNEQDYQQEDQDEDIEIKKQVELLNSDDSENEDKVRNIAKPSPHPPGVGVFQQQIYHPVPQQQSQQQMNFHPHLNHFIDIPSQSTPQIQQQSFDSYNKQSSTPNQQLEYINQKRIVGPRPMSIDQQFSQFFTTPNQQQIMSIPEKCGSPLQFTDYTQQQGQSPYVIYESPAHQHMQSIYNQGMKQPTNSMNNIIQFNQMNTPSPPIQNNQQNNYQIFQQHPQMQQMICQIPAQHNIGIQQPQQNQQNNQQQQQQTGQIYNQNQISIGQQGQQQMMAMIKNQKQHLQIQPNSLFSSNSSSTYHLQKQNCNLSQASTIDSADYINTFRSGSSYGVQEVVQQDQVVKMIKQQSQQIQQQLQVRSQCLQSQVQQQQGQQGPQLNQQLNFFPNHPLANQQEKNFFQQTNTNANQFLLESFSSQPPLYPMNQFQQNQQIPFTSDYIQTAFPLQYLQVYIPQNHAQVVQQPIGQISPEKFEQIPQPPPPHLFANSQQFNSQDIQKLSKNQFQSKQQMQGYNKPSHSKQLSCQQLGQFDQQNQVQQLQQNQIQFGQGNQYQLKNNKFNQEGCNVANQSQQGNSISNNSMTFQNKNQINNANVNSQPIKGKKKLEIKEEDISYDIDLDKLGQDKRTTVCIKNIPNKYQLNCVLQTIEKNHKDNFDFFYLPIDFNVNIFLILSNIIQINNNQNKCNVGYAFINFIKPEYIREFYLEFNGKKWKKFNSDKICSLKYATIQGIPQLQEHFQNSSVMNQREKKFKPVFLNVISNMIDKQKLQSTQNESNKSNFNDDSSSSNQQMNKNSFMEGNSSQIQNEQVFSYNNNRYSYQNNYSQHSNSSNINSNNNNNSSQGGQSNTNYHKKNNSNSNNNYFNRYHNSNQKNYNSNKHEYVQKQ